MSKRLWMVLSLGLIYGSGFMTGWFCQLYRVKSGRLACGAGGAWKMQRLSSELQLTPQQQEELRGILERARMKTHQLQFQVSPNIARIRDESREEVEDVLTPEQYLHLVTLDSQKPKKK